MKIYKHFSFEIPSQEDEKTNQIKNLLKSLDVKYEEYEEIGDEIIKDYGVKIILDEEKIIKENIYTLEQIYTKLDAIAKKTNMIKIDKYRYVPMEKNSISLAVFNIYNLLHQDWMKKYAKEWLRFDEREGNKDMIKRFLQEE